MYEFSYLGISYFWILFLRVFLITAFLKLALGDWRNKIQHTLDTYHQISNFLQN